MRCLILFCCLGAWGQDSRLRYPPPPQGSVETVLGTAYRTVPALNLQFDVYRPASARRAPVVVFLNGIGVKDLKRWPIYQDWARAVTERGLAGITMDSRVESVAEDFHALITYLHAHEDELRVDSANVLLWACSANVTAAIPIAMDAVNRELRAAVFYYGSGEVKEFRLDLPVLYVRVGTDDAVQNRAIDATVARAFAANAPFTVLNLPSARHAFDSLDDDPVTHETIKRTLDFMQAHAQRQLQETVSKGVPMGKAVSAVYREDLRVAVETFRSLVEQRPKESELRRRYGDALFNAGDYGRAIEAYERAIALGNGRAAWIAYSAGAASMRLHQP